MWDRGDGIRLAWEFLPGNGPTLVFLPGFRDNMLNPIANKLKNFCKEKNVAFLRFDYSGHGKSEGNFEDGIISAWADDARMLIENFTSGDIIIVGFSMGSWIAFLIYQFFESRLKGILGISSAIDFSENSVFEKMGIRDKARLLEHGFVERSGPSGNAYKITKSFIDDGRHNSLLNNPIKIEVPVRLFHGAADEHIPPATSNILFNDITCEDVFFVLVKKARHSFSEQSDIDILITFIDKFIKD
jgi:pimeloyl-ACP methyl ester carboxylesterase